MVLVKSSSRQKALESEKILSCFSSQREAVIYV
jgi:hypothetical protein